MPRVEVWRTPCGFETTQNLGTNSMLQKPLVTQENLLSHRVGSGSKLFGFDFDHWLQVKV